MTWLDFLSQNLVAFIALIVSIVSAIYTSRGVSDRARAAARRAVDEEVSQLNRKLEREVSKLQEGLDKCIKDRIGLKGEMQILKSALEIAYDEIKKLKGNVENNT